MRRSRDTRDSNKRGRVFLREYFSVASIRRHSKTDTMPYLYSGISNEKSIGWVLLPLSLFIPETKSSSLDPSKILGRNYSFQLTRNDDFRQIDVERVRDRIRDPRGKNDEKRREYFPISNKNTSLMGKIAGVDR